MITTFALLAVVLLAELVGTAAWLYFKQLASHGDTIRAPGRPTSECFVTSHIQTTPRVGIEVHTESGLNTAYYDISRKVLSLQNDVAKRDDLTALALAAHELGHALQDAGSPRLIRWRRFILPLESSIGVIGILSLVLATYYWHVLAMQLALALLAGGVLLKLPLVLLELDASARARELLLASALFSHRELRLMYRLYWGAALSYLGGAGSGCVVGLLRIARQLSRSLKITIFWTFYYFSSHSTTYHVNSSYFNSGLFQ